jgi:hypothetical protein
MDGWGRGKVRSMSSDSNAPSPTVNSDSSNAPSSGWRWEPAGSAIKYVSLIVALASWFGMRPLRFFSPDIADRLLDVYLACLLVLFFLFLGALLFRRWKEVAIFFAIWAMVLLPSYGPSELPRWLYVEAFRRHATPIEEYLSRCKLIEFVENDAKQKVGVCERLPLPGDGTLTIVYDTTGQLASPVSQRTPQWTKAMGRFSPGRVFTQIDDRADYLFGNFYEVFIPVEDADGAADED